MANNQDAKVVTKTSHTAPATSTNVATTVTSAPSSTLTLDKPPGTLQFIFVYICFFKAKALLQYRMDHYVTVHCVLGSPYHI